MEAGNRCFDEKVPEETNRHLVDHVADFNLVYTEHARRNLLAGAPVHEVLEHYRAQIEASDVLDRLDLSPRGYFIAIAHRETNVDPPLPLQMLLDCLAAVQKPYELPIILSTHPRTRKRLEALGVEFDTSGVRWLEPFGFHDYNKLQFEA